MPAPVIDGRPTRLNRIILILGALVLAVEFVTAIGLWQAHEIQEYSDEPPQWAGTVRKIHGLFNPLACILFGYLLYAHIPLGWKMRANRVSGVVMTATFA